MSKACEKERKPPNPKDISVSPSAVFSVWCFKLIDECRRVTSLLPHFFVAQESWPLCRVPDFHEKVPILSLLFLFCTCTSSARLYAIYSPHWKKPSIYTKTDGWLVLRHFLYFPKKTKSKTKSRNLKATVRVCVCTHWCKSHNYHQSLEILLQREEPNTRLSIYWTFSFYVLRFSYFSLLYLQLKTHRKNSDVLPALPFFPRYFSSHAVCSGQGCQFYACIFIAVGRWPFSSTTS